MKTKLSLFLFFSLFFIPVKSQNGIDKTVFYSVLANQNIKEIDDELSDLKNSAGKEAFEGALLMKKSGLITDPKEKLNLFKSGRTALELAIKTNSSNAEYRFLRLVVQENAAKIVQYSAEIKKDASYIRKNYKNLPTVVQKAILNYSKKSKELNPEDFENATHE